MKALISAKNLTRLCFSFWLIFLVVIMTVVYFQGKNHTVTPAYLSGAFAWLKGKKLYHGARGFIYLPQAAFLFTPIALIAKYSFTLAEVVWRFISVSLLGLAVWRFSALVESKKTQGQVFFVTTLMTILLAFSSARNGQFNIIIEALMLLALVALAHQRWSIAAFCLVLGVALKPTAVVLLLLAVACFPMLWWRLVIGFVIMLALPLVAKPFPYVISQYVQSVTMLKSAGMLGATVFSWSQLFGFLAQFKILVPALWQNVIRVIAALITCYCGYKAKANSSEKNTAIFLYSLAACYLMLFNPRTENTDYGIIAPALGAFFSVFYFKRQYSLALMALSVCVGLIFSGHFTLEAEHNYDIWSAPFFTIIFLILTIKTILTWDETCKVQSKWAKNFYLTQRD